MARCYVGCSGFSYNHWNDNFYPAGVERFSFYTSQFDSLEINSSFYRLPSASVFYSWYRRSPAHMTFTVKAPQTITHRKKLKDADDIVQRFYENTLELGDKMKCVLWQLPPNFSIRMYDRVKKFCDSIHNRFPNSAFEFRHPSWMQTHVPQLLSAYDFEFVRTDFHKYVNVSMDGSSSKFQYYRLHGPTGQYHGRYTDEFLENIADRLTDGSFVFFDNDSGGQAPRDAKRLIKILETRNEIKL
ncbi:DUF72 domain-containing protein [Rhizobium phage RHph_TM40]|uniref:DUF72 domain-containing protein n=2 Tax=Cuauhnahuacvirus TaxID=3044696 RepID=A0A7S5UW13_9CAUD|nr:DUF72 domain-containing protein [Rhizobium phage RHph_TM30]YP_010671416.1 DUF72 domain-containing protein [Rhizobium phage RHph_Y65]QIG71737.1 DUF72 domain-containing protein [Rhizobium phage RHph_TM40]QIG72100.1 DUF72 domain-containing protein [Rhizobium phage RHph_TM2_3B]QIG72462.1 DUF72 domain-containing protein [Rhizobium phage RHph_TM3_3_6]QIG71373.1 DUF72 domain-containing protein [Rhizobium phage RHph_TM30]QIG72825.1 DUF72 domain-containing protein [Rhizobium phage RHph_Y65]